MIKILNVNTNHIDSIMSIANENSNILAVNNRMIYYLCCTVLKKYSFVALENNKIMGYLFAFPDGDNKYIWIHQIAVSSLNTNKGIGSVLLKEIENIVEKDSKLQSIKFAVKPDNFRAISFYKKHNYKLSKFDANIGMQIFIKEFN